MTVSYTHLDVYKRQQSGRHRSKCTLKKKKKPLVTETLVKNRKVSTRKASVKLEMPGTSL